MVYIYKPGNSMSTNSIDLLTKVKHQTLDIPWWLKKTKKSAS